LLAVLFASVRIAATYTVFNQTFDEPLHIACGIEWLGGIVCADETPPLARVAEAIGPYLLGARSSGRPYSGMDAEYTAGAAILYRGDRYDLTLALARLGNLPFFWLACLVLYLWGNRYFGPGVAAAAVLLFSFLPPVLAHAGLATVDMGLTALLSAAFLSGVAWLERPALRPSVIFGATMALAMLAKYSAPVFFAASAILAFVLYTIFERPGVRLFARAALRRISWSAIALATAAAFIWAAYRFTIGLSTMSSIRLPAPQLFSGLKMVADHNAGGHYAYLLGERRTSGWWYFYPVVLAVKTPLAFLALMGTGAVLAFGRMRASRAWLPIAFSGGILIVGLFSRINIGVRHILPVYVGFSLAAAIGLIRILELGETSKWLRNGLVVLLLWLAASSLLAHPDYLPYFNELAGGHPENVLLDSDLDWGQDMKRLAKRLKKEGAAYVTFTPFSDGGLLQVLGFPPVQLSDVPIPSPGWNAVSLTVWKSRRLNLLNTHPEITPWPDLAPPGDRVGEGIRLWYFPPGSIPGR
jgi:4-amino-4-deoxy-L-arabinose transferase-like glycosyltransferase